MRKLIYVLLFLLTLPIAAANPIYQQDSLQVELSVQGEFNLEAESSGSTISEVSAELLLFPVETKRQRVLEIDNWGDVENDKVTYEWDDPDFGSKKFGYTAIVKTNNERLQIRDKISFPLRSTGGYDEYTLPSPKIDSNNPLIIRKAREIVDGEDDLFKAAFKLANWVSENVEYDLNELTTDIAQPASWVLENKQGVCDEMTSLFVAMARSQGIPARFVSGISYTEHAGVVALVGSNWASHGWAEVYFPGSGWVSFDITFDEYGYVDATHIKLREGLDPDEPATTYRWLADRVTLKTSPLKIDANIQKQGQVIPEEVLLEQEVFAQDTDFGSYNLVKGILKNTADYYVATTLRLAAPQEVEIIGENRRTILLGPKEVKETFWPLKLTENLDSGFTYRFPLLIYSEKNVSVEDEFNAAQGEQKFTRADIDAVLIVDEDKSYSRKISFNCEYKRELAVDEDTDMRCTITNNGGTELQNVEFCVEKQCDTISLKPLASSDLTIGIIGEKIGWNNIVVTAENAEIEKKTSFTYLVFDSAMINVNVDSPETVIYPEDFEVVVALTKDSFNTPEDVVVIVEGTFFEKKWEIAKLNTDQVLTLNVNGDKMGSKNKFTVTTMWKDAENRFTSDTQEFVVRVETENFGDKFQLWVNWLLSLLSI
jgi:transglutaminase-like putative cysteine protease